MPGAVRVASASTTMTSPPYHWAQLRANRKARGRLSGADCVERPVVVTAEIASNTASIQVSPTVVNGHARANDPAMNASAITANASLR